VLAKKLHLSTPVQQLRLFHITTQFKQQWDTQSQLSYQCSHGYEDLTTKSTTKGIA
jgi:hypothetical protein